MPELDLATKLADWKVKRQGRIYDDANASDNKPWMDEVYLFDASVRYIRHSSACPEYGSAVKNDHAPNDVCPCWTASTDLATWEQAITRAGFWWSRWMASTAPEGFTTVWRGKGLPKTTTGCSLSDLLSCVEQVLKEDKYA